MAKPWTGGRQGAFCMRCSLGKEGMKRAMRLIASRLTSTFTLPP